MKRIFFLLLNIWAIALTAQSVAYSSSQMFDDLLRLKNKGSVMYLAAHPDDENTRMISWLTHEKHIDAVYLSLTRGDGGQNLIGTEKGEALGLLRTQELLEARKIDQGRQWFTRAVDFGYSKTTEDTFNHWDRTEILADVVWAIRVNQPEIIFTRFHPDSNGETHGHHTASAQLAMQAFDLAADPNAFPEQLKMVSTWQVKRIFYNTSWWFYGSEEAFEKVDKSNMMTVDLGAFLPHLGVSNNEIAAISRSKHASQGFGTALARGSETEWLALLKGDKPKGNSIFEGINFGWNNSKIQQLIDKIIADFDFKNPEKSTSDLVKLYHLLDKNAPEHKRDLVKDLILKSKGIYLEWTTPEKFGVNGQKISTQLEMANRSSTDLTFSVEGNAILVKSNSTKKVQKDEIITKKEIDSPYWLEKPTENNFFVTQDYQLLGLPESRNPLTKKISLKLNGTEVHLEIPLRQKVVDPSVGERYQRFYVVPQLAVKFLQPNYIFGGQTQSVEVEVTSFVGSAKGKIRLKSADGWHVSPEQTFVFTQKEEKQFFRFEVTPSKSKSISDLKAEVFFDDEIFTKSIEIIDYPHVDRQIYLNAAHTQLQQLTIEIPKVKVAYIHGSGDEIPDALRQMGVRVDEININNWKSDLLDTYQVVMLGIRAFNTIPQLEYVQNDIWDFVARGGTAIVQYNTSRELTKSRISPFYLKLGRDRIAEEDAPLHLLQPHHSVFNFPNKINQADFSGWQQERGLYFADEWDENLTPLLEGNDTGESPKKGILLVGNYGKGHYVYTGISFFRQLPAGVSGAYRLLMNLLALGEE